ncbi:DUF317 domain-containing protein [Kitasatospora sp. NPDC047058]|uniref:DUF317 domain-containing protein n=1 Tax=Kitasatospora sp. NPDC047058 TaxID=3155620 RepID=UPI0034072E27
MAGPGDAEAALAHFLETSPTWHRYSPGQDTTVALHESLLAAIELDHDTTAGPRWTIAAYASPVGRRTWNATFCTRTPVEVVTAVAERLSHALTATSETVRDELLWGRRSLDNTIAADLEAADEPWSRETSPVHGVYSYTRPDDTAGIAVNHNIGDIRGIGPTVTVWGGPRGYPGERWHAAFTGHTPNALISAALDEVVNPLPTLRQRLQIPAANRTQVHLEPGPRRNLPPGTGQQSAREGPGEAPAEPEPEPAGPSSPDPNAVTIRRTDEGTIVASGGDAHTAFLVGTTGFAPTPGSPDHYTLPTGHQQYEENEIATDTAVLLATAGYDVTLDPTLGVRPSPPPFIAVTGDRLPSNTAEQLAERIDDVTTHLLRATDPAEARRVAGVITGEGGVLDRSTRALRAAGGWALHHRVGGDAGEALRLTAEIVASGREAADHAVGRLGTDRSPRSAAARARTTPAAPVALPPATDRPAHTEVPGREGPPPKSR